MTQAMSDLYSISLAKKIIITIEINQCEKRCLFFFFLVSVPFMLITISDLLLSLCSIYFRKNHIGVL